MSKRILIFDTTLRDGEQVPGAKLNTVEKLEIAQELEKLGVDIIEAGFPISSPEDFKSVSEVALKIKDCTVCALARALEEDITVAYNAIKKSANPRIHTFISSSDIHLEKQIRKGREQILRMTAAAVKQAKSYVNDVEFSAMDASRSDFDFLCTVIRLAIDSGATTINIPDTVGYAIPNEWGDMMARLVAAVPELKDEVVLSVHTHNDLGLATANSLVAIESGARQVECTINGIGERAGNCALEEIVMALNVRYKGQFENRIVPDKISKISRMVSQIMRIPVQPNKAIVGANAFAHSSGIHQDGVLKSRENFEIIHPNTVGVEESGIILTSRSGRAALKYRLEKLGYDLAKIDIKQLYEDFLKMSDQKKDVHDEDLHLLMSGKTDTQEKKGRYVLELLQVLSGNKNVPVAIVQILDRVEEKVVEGMSTGTGPIDAALKSIRHALDLSYPLKEYLVQAITEGLESPGRVSVHIETGGRSYFGYGADKDTLVASAKAYINAVNKVKTHCDASNSPSPIYNNTTKQQK